MVEFPYDLHYRTSSGWKNLSNKTHEQDFELLARLLSSRVGSPISFQALAEDVEAARESIKTWMRLMEILYFGFFIPPYSRRIERAIKKEKKWYFFQWGKTKVIEI